MSKYEFDNGKLYKVDRHPIHPNEVCKHGVFIIYKNTDGVEGRGQMVVDKVLKTWVDVEETLQNTSDVMNFYPENGWLAYSGQGHIAVKFHPFDKRQPIINIL